MASLIRPLVSLCSANEAKLREVREALPGLEIELLAVDYPPEEGATYLDNARIKARHGRAVGPRDHWMLADDSGVELAALDGAPGVRTARWAEGRHVERALAAVDGARDRSARYVCELVCLSPEGDELRGTGVLDGAIAEAPAGAGGFGFDPVFVPHGESATVAELGDDWKATHSHRALAARELSAALERHRAHGARPTS
ncbi:MAG TPA: non-canonical purine NTP pyrophosphatase [Gaiellaceae bacterium]|nr:non-canonical purine NTP pyrophosphatase [Gaiellaceae bacterium]